MKNSTILVKLNRIAVHLVTIISVVVIYSCQEDGDFFPTISSEVTTEYLLNGDLVVYLQNELVFRYKGKPGITTIQIGKDNLSDYENCFILYVASGAESLGTVSSAVIKLAGQQVLNTSDFSNKEIQHDFEVCNLTEQSILEVEIKGEPGSYLDIWMEGKLKNIGSVTDIDGNTYKTVKIGNQIWMAENLKVTTYNDGTDIPYIFENSAWNTLTTPGFCWQINDEATYKNLYGGLYNWYAVNTGKLCPTGWHVSTDNDWLTLEMFLGMSQEDRDNNTGDFRGTDQGTQLKNTTGWYGPATNTVGFSALPGGTRDDINGGFYYTGTQSNGWWWSPQDDNSGNITYRGLQSNVEGVQRPATDKKYGFSVRCVKDN